MNYWYNNNDVSIVMQNVRTNQKVQTDWLYLNVLYKMQTKKKVHGSMRKICSVLYVYDFIDVIISRYKTDLLILTYVLKWYFNRAIKMILNGAGELAQSAKSLLHSLEDLTLGLNIHLRSQLEGSRLELFQLWEGGDRKISGVLGSWSRQISKPKVQRETLSQNIKCRAVGEDTLYPASTCTHSLMHIHTHVHSNNRMRMKYFMYSDNCHWIRKR